MKIGVASPHLIPRHAICDPLLTVGAPPVVTAHAGIDALSHADRVLHGGARGAVGRARPRPPAGRQEPALGRAGADRRAATSAATSRARSRTAPTSRRAPACSTARCWPASRSATPASAPRTRCSSRSARPRTRRTAWAPACCCRTSWSTTGRRGPTRSRELSALMGGDAVAQVHALGLRIGLPGVAGGDRRGAGATCAAMAEAAVGIKRLVDNNPRPLDADALEAILDAAWHGEPERLRSGGRGASVREVAHGALEVRRHPRLGGLARRRTRARRAPRGARARSPTVTPSSAAAGRRRGGSRRSASRRGARGAASPPR